MITSLLTFLLRTLPRWFRLFEKDDRDYKLAARLRGEK